MRPFRPKGCGHRVTAHRFRGSNINEIKVIRKEPSHVINDVWRAQIDNVNQTIGAFLR